MLLVLQDVMRNVVDARLGAKWLEQNRHLLRGDVDIPHAACLTEHQVRSWVDNAVYSDVGYQRLRDATLLTFQTHATSVCLSLSVHVRVVV